MVYVAIFRGFSQISDTDEYGMHCSCRAFFMLSIIARIWACNVNFIFKIYFVTLFAFSGIIPQIIRDIKNRQFSPDLLFC